MHTCAYMRQKRARKRQNVCAHVYASCVHTSLQKISGIALNNLMNIRPIRAIEVLYRLRDKQ